MNRAMFSFYQKKSRSFTLIETLIGLALSAILLSTLTYFYRQLDFLHAKMDKSQTEMFQIAYSENRLSRALTQALSPQNDQFYFFTGESSNGSPTLIFSYNNGVSLDPLFSQEVLGKLYVDGEGDFCLATWPKPVLWESPVTTPMKKEVLLQGVEKIAFEFFSPPERDRAKILPSPKKKSSQARELPKDVWLTSWFVDYWQLPALVRVRVWQAKKESLFAFPLPHSDLFIAYDR